MLLGSCYDFITILVVLRILRVPYEELSSSLQLVLLPLLLAPIPTVSSTPALTDASSLGNDSIDGLFTLPSELMLHYRIHLFTTHVDAFYRCINQSLLAARILGES